MSTVDEYMAEATTEIRAGLSGTDWFGAGTVDAIAASAVKALRPMLTRLAEESTGRDSGSDAGHRALHERLGRLRDRLANRVDEDGLIDQHAVLIPLAKILDHHRPTSTAVIVDLNGDFDVSALGGRGFTLDDMVSADAHLDPLYLIDPAPGTGRVLNIRALADTSDLIHADRHLDPLRFAEKAIDITVYPHGDFDVDTLGDRVAPIEFNGDGLLDPLRHAATPAAGIDTAVTAIITSNPFADGAPDFTVPLTDALAFGVRRGATCVGDALLLAREAGRANPTMVAEIFAMAEASPLFRTMIGFDLLVRPAGDQTTDTDRT